MEAEEAVILSDYFELAIFLVQFPMVGMVEHEEEQEQDSFAFLSDRAEGFNWGK